MGWDPEFKPQLRPLEAFPIQDGNGNRVGLRDPGGLSDKVISLSGAALHVMTMMDGTNTCRQIQDKAAVSFGAPLEDNTLQSMIEQLEQARFMDGPAFEEYYQSRLEEYRGARVREMPHASALGIVDDSGAIFEEMLADAEPTALPKPVVGLIAPHLDYPRGRACYAAAYLTLRARPTPDRVVILGANHFGRSTSVVATANDFQTPLGTTRTDLSFIEGLEACCGHLREHELDHAREHSIELQVAWLQHLFGADSFAVVPFLCPDPCGPTGTAPCDNNGVDLRDFAAALADLVAKDDRDTLLVAGADLSHVGAAFGDSRSLDAAFLEDVRAHDYRALANLSANDPDGWLRCLAEDNNPMHVCSAGCIYVLVSAVRGATGTILRYYQAVDQSSQTCVTCAAVAFA
ncbi:MAG: AmmeMemoRadiSam system protein B [Phycisphaerales bacterium]|nr:MAG: AmmeMemoRadiSam system protein B [Phycisphaerales bacterium]